MAQSSVKQLRWIFTFKEVLCQFHPFYWKDYFSFTIKILSLFIFSSSSGLDSTFGGLEAMITALCDEYPRLLGRNRELFVLVLLAGVYVCSLPTCTYVSNRYNCKLISLKSKINKSRKEIPCSLNQKLKALTCSKVLFVLLLFILFIIYFITFIVN